MLDRRERFVQRAGTATYANWEEMLAQEPLDIVSVATYAPVHAEITVACAKQGIRAIYCEKPIATRLPDAEQMLEACDEAGALLALNHQRRFNLNHRRLRELIAADGLGELTSASLQWGSGRLGNVGHTYDRRTPYAYRPERSKQSPRRSTLRANLIVADPTSVTPVGGVS